MLLKKCTKPNRNYQIFFIEILFVVLFFIYSLSFHVTPVRNSFPLKYLTLMADEFLVKKSLFGFWEKRKSVERKNQSNNCSLQIIIHSILLCFFAFVLLVATCYKRIHKDRSIIFTKYVCTYPPPTVNRLKYPDCKGYTLYTLTLCCRLY